MAPEIADLLFQDMIRVDILDIISYHRMLIDGSPGSYPEFLNAVHRRIVIMIDQAYSRIKLLDPKGRLFYIRNIVQAGYVSLSGLDTCTVVPKRKWNAIAYPLYARLDPDGFQTMLSTRRDFRLARKVEAEKKKRLARYKAV